MVVDDELIVLKLLRLTLEQEGYYVITAENGETALELLDNHDLALVLLDIMMPGLNGFQVLDQIRKHSDIPVIMLTAKRDESDFQYAFSLGVDDYIRKPFHKQELLARIRAKLRRAESETIPV
jgi:DNA-binding response OmpR family regulator